MAQMHIVMKSMDDDTRMPVCVCYDPVVAENVAAQLNNECRFISQILPEIETCHTYWLAVPHTAFIEVEPSPKRPRSPTAKNMAEYSNSVSMWFAKNREAIEKNDALGEETRAIAASHAHAKAVALGATDSMLKKMGFTKNVNGDLVSWSNPDCDVHYFVTDVPVVKADNGGECHEI
jgi:hypothetical protein